MEKDKTMIEVLFVPIDNVEPNPYNPNVMEEEKRLELKRLMAATNARTFFGRDPLRASPYDVFYGKKLDVEEKHEGRFVFIDGAHRWLNAKELDWTEVGLAIEPMTIVQARRETYSRNYLRGKIDIIKEAKLFQDEVNDGLTREQVAEKYFKDPSYVSKSLGLLTLSEKVLDFLNPKDEKPALTKSHLEALVGLPEEEALQLAEMAANYNMSARRVAEQAESRKQRIAEEERRAEAASHFVLRECPVDGAPGKLEDNLKHMCCSKDYFHYELGLRKVLRWGPLDTKEGLLKRKFKLDDGRELPLEEIVKKKGKPQGTPKKRLDWFKFEAPVDQLMPKVNAFAYEMLLANNPTISRIGVSGKTKDGDFHLDTSERQISVRIGDKSLFLWFEPKEWKRKDLVGFKTKVNVRDVDEEMDLKKVQMFLDKLMKGEAKVEDYPFDAHKMRLITPALEESEEPEEGDEE